MEKEFTFHFGNVLAICGWRSWQQVSNECTNRAVVENRVKNRERQTQT
jgi:hypothetical protein